MTLVELLSTLHDRRINVWAEGERLRYSAPSGALTPDLRQELARHKSDLLTFLNETRRVRRVARDPIHRISREEKLPLSINQRRLWFIERLQPNTAFNCHRAYRIKGSLDVTSLERSLVELVRRHEALRTIFSAIDGEPFQVITPALKFRLTMIDLRDIVDTTEREFGAERIMTEAVERPFDLERGPLFRAHLLRVGAEEHLLLLAMHHIITDGWSMGLLVNELTVLYDAFCSGNPSPLPELPIQYADFAHWQSKWLQGEVLRQELAHWKERLKGAPEVTDLVTDYSRPAVQSFRGASEPLLISKPLTEALKTLGQRQGVTLFMTLLAAFKTLLYRYTGQEDLVLGSPIAGRSRGDIESVMGLFINTLVLRTDLSGSPSFRELLSRVRDVALDAYDYQEVPFEKLMEELHLERSLSFTPLFQVMFVLQNTPESDLKLSGSTISPVAIKRETALFDLFLSMAEGTQGLRGKLSYKTDLFDRTTIRGMIERFQVLLQGIVANLDQSISTIPLLTETEKHQLLVKWNDTRRDYPKAQCIHELFEAQVEKTPDAIAVVFEDQQLTYRELNRRANQLAHDLRKLGVGPDVLVAICVERSLEMVVGLLGILKAGGAYVPLDSQYPKQRLAFLLDDTRVSVLLTQQRLVADLPEHGARVVCLDVEEEPIRIESAENPVSGATADTLAYVIYTSGSTGEPKGVMISHRGICNRFVWGQEAYQLTDSDRVLHAFSLSFDFATWEIFTSLVAGSRLIMAKPGGSQDTDYLVKLIRGSKITLAGFVPSMLQAILDESEVKGCNTLKRVVCGGESLSVELQERVLAWQDVELHNTYGPTEASIDVTSWVCGREKESGSKRQRVPIGRPIANTQIYILDSHLQAVPFGVPGELHIGGVGLARGYVNRPDLTAEKFIPNPFSNAPGARLYKTGDLARYVSDGNIEFLGRIDNQVKIRGFRIELGEIEAVLGQHPEVRDAVAVLREDGDKGKGLTAYVVPRQDLPVAVEDLRNFLKQKLPNYMVPSAFVLLNSLPLTPNGKVDRSALPDCDSASDQQQAGLVAPRDELELQLTKLWEKVLKVRPIGLRDNFFDLGGHSLLAARLFAQIEKVFGKRLPLTALFQGPTIERLAGLIRNQDWSAPWKSLVAIQPGGIKPPFFCVHAHDGNVLFWRDLARHLGSNQPFYAFQPQGLDGREILHSRIEEMAAHYVKEMRALQPEGPYFIGGHCLGGVVAFEMAQQLHRQGEKVGMLALFDSYAPRIDRVTKRSKLQRYAYKAVRIFETVNLHLGNLSVLEPGETLPYIKGKFNKALYKLYMYFGSSWIPAARNRRSILTVASRAARNYQPTVYPGKVTLFRARTLGRGINHDAQMGWGRLAGGGLEIHRIPGYHAHIVLEPRVRLLAKELAESLRQTEEIAESEAVQDRYEIAVQAH